MNTQTEYHITNNGRVLEFEDGTILSVVTIAEMLFGSGEELPPVFPRKHNNRSKWATKHSTARHRWMYAGQ
jgi:hypothetical protein